MDEKQNEKEHKEIKEEINEDELFNKLTQKIFITPIEKIKKALIKLNYKGRMETNKMLLNMQLSKEFNTIEKIKKLLNELDDIEEPKTEKKLYSDINEYKDALKKLYKQKALKYHPDKNVGNEEQAKKKFQALGNQYEKKMKQIEEHEKQQKEAVPQKGQRRKRN